MTPTRKMTRRSFLGRVAGGVAGGAALMAFSTTEAEAFQCTDSDTGRNADRAGRGRRCRRPANNCTDRDTGRYADPVGRGRRCRRRSCTDSDTGRNSDPVGRGRRC